MTPESRKEKIIRKILRRQKKIPNLLSSMARFDLSRVTKKFQQIVHEERSRLDYLRNDCKVDFVTIYKYKNVFVSQVVFKKSNSDDYKTFYDSETEYLRDILTVHKTLENALGNINDVDLLFHALESRERFLNYISNRY
jgi:hypothetical protein